MPQQRFYDYSKPATSTSENAIHYAIGSKGVYRGMDLGVDATFNNLSVAPGYGLQHDGIIWNESTELTLEFSPPVVATVYTAIATHDNRPLIGGVAVVYSLQEGELTSADILNGIVLGWIFHPGSTVPLDVSHILSAPKALNEEYVNSSILLQPTELVAPLQRSIVTATGLDLTFSEVDFDAVNFVVLQDITSAPTAVGIQALIQQVQFYVDSGSVNRPVSFSFYHNFTTVTTTNLIVEVYGTDQSPVNFSGGAASVTINGAGGWNETTVYLDRTDGVFDLGKPYTLRLTYNIAPGESFKLSRIKTNFWPFP